jgi:hypothetical protein
VFPGRTPAQPGSTMAFLILLRRLKHDAMSTHGFRSSFRDWAAEKTNVPRAVCEAALAHTLRDKTEAAYYRTDLFDRRRELMDTWAKFATAKPGRCGVAQCLTIAPTASNEIAGSTLTTESARVENTMQWEYQLETGKFEEFNDLTKRLNELGKEGWEAVGIAGDSQADQFTVLLKREKKSESTSATWGR